MSAGVLALQVALGLGMAGLAVSVLFLRDLMASAVALAGFSLLLALEFYVLQAPDVAIAEAGIGAGLTTAIFMVAIRAVSAKGKKQVAAAAPLGDAASSRGEQAAEQAPSPTAPPAETRQDAASPESESPTPDIPNLPNVPSVPSVPQVPDVSPPTPPAPEKEAP